MSRIQTLIERENIFHTEGEKGFQNLQKLVKLLGYKEGISEFLKDNSGAIEAITKFIEDNEEAFNDKLNELGILNEDNIFKFQEFIDGNPSGWFEATVDIESVARGEFHNINEKMTEENLPTFIENNQEIKSVLKKYDYLGGTNQHSFKVIFQYLAMKFFNDI